MIKGYIEVVVSVGFSHESRGHRIEFTDLDAGMAEYHRVVEIMKANSDKKNDLPKTTEVCCGVNRVTLPVDSLSSVGLVDYALANEHAAGVRDAYPNIFKR